VKSRISINDGKNYLLFSELSIFDKQIIKQNWDEIAFRMDDDRRELIHGRLAPCTILEFLEAYLDEEGFDLLFSF
jgi:hypothetical protein